MLDTCPPSCMLDKKSLSNSIHYQLLFCKSCKMSISLLESFIFRNGPLEGCVFGGTWIHTCDADSSAPNTSERSWEVLCFCFRSLERAMTSRRFLWIYCSISCDRAGVEERFGFAPPCDYNGYSRVISSAIFLAVLGIVVWREEPGSAEGDTGRFDMVVWFSIIKRSEK